MKQNMPMLLFEYVRLSKGTWGSSEIKFLSGKQRDLVSQLEIKSVQ